MNLEKYTRLFVDEAGEHLGEMSRALTTLDSAPSPEATEEAVDTLFRMAHSIKGMAASLEFESIASLAHRLEDWMEPLRRGATDGLSLALLSETLRAFEEMVRDVDRTGAAPPSRDELLAKLAQPGGAPATIRGETPRKKASRSSSPRRRPPCAFVPRSWTVFSPRWAS